MISHLRMLYLIFMFLARQCLGVSNQRNLEGRIVKGFDVDIESYPHSVFLRFDKYVPATCGSNLITEQAVVTAAHCLHELKYLNGKITAFLGATIPLISAIKRNVVLYAIHPRYNAEKGKFNLGIGYFDKPVSFNSIVQKIPIICTHPEPDEALYTSGWGKGKPNKIPDYSDTRHLKASKQRFISERDCEKKTGARMTPAFWCTVTINGYHYHGDAGNGLVRTNQKYKLLIGVVSYMVNEVTIYSNVVEEQLWINNTVMYLFKKKCKKDKETKSSSNKKP